MHHQNKHIHQPTSIPTAQIFNHLFNYLHILSKLHNYQLVQPHKYGAGPRQLIKAKKYLYQVVALNNEKRKVGFHPDLTYQFRSRPNLGWTREFQKSFAWHNFFKQYIISIMVYINTTTPPYTYTITTTNTNTHPSNKTHLQPTTNTQHQPSTPTNNPTPSLSISIS